MSRVAEGVHQKARPVRSSCGAAGGAGPLQEREGRRGQAHVAGGTLKLEGAEAKMLDTETKLSRIETGKTRSGRKRRTRKASQASDVKNSALHCKQKRDLVRLE